MPYFMLKHATARLRPFLLLTRQQATADANRGRGGEGGVALQRIVGPARLTAPSQSGQTAVNTSK